MSNISSLLFICARRTTRDSRRERKDRGRKQRQKEGREHVKTSNLLLSRCEVNEVMMLYSSCLLHLLQIRVNCSLCSGFFFFFFWGRNMSMRHKRLEKLLLGGLPCEGLHLQASFLKKILGEDGV